MKSKPGSNFSEITMLFKTAYRIGILGIAFLENGSIASTTSV
ncbi:hypothetical protein SAMN02745246_01006 [Leeuwenhoekiella marinoflava DSM 3653]|uniref:Uncharacterized protein n=2 Tax=Leeuwenhoekiella marinoflava TaxID=988 RepID=A0A4Q0PP86_9FLAO|nr:hypothetical protein DSL99_1153 [Leeuwenhoekiella marinoflava]SHE78283.1 hypothetical protein SAMN02745246_01006 [Leeuwenhoekiella marinoflava DSM 3653]